jgi:hypothetical protein
MGGIREGGRSRAEAGSWEAGRDVESLRSPEYGGENDDHPPRDSLSGIEALCRSRVAAYRVAVRDRNVKGQGTQNSLGDLDSFNQRT